MKRLDTTETKVVQTQKMNTFGDAYLKQISPDILLVKYKLSTE